MNNSCTEKQTLPTSEIKFEPLGDKDTHQPTSQHRADSSHCPEHVNKKRCISLTHPDTLTDTHTNNTSGIRKETNQTLKSLKDATHAAGSLARRDAGSLPAMWKKDWCPRCFAGLIGNRLRFMLMSADISLECLHSIKERSKGPKSRLFSQASPPVQVQAQRQRARLSFKTRQRTQQIRQRRKRWWIFVSRKE